MHVVTAGEALLAPSVTRRIVEQFARRPVRPELGTRLDALTEREREVLKMLAHGKSNAELAAELFVTEGTIKTHVSSLLASSGSATECRPSSSVRERWSARRVDAPLSFDRGASGKDLP